MKPLQQIYDEVSKLPGRMTDKGWGAYGPQPGGPGHTYAQIYDLLLSKWRNEPIDFLEVGINRGGSLKMWKEFFTQANVVGIDILNSFDPFTSDEGIETHVFDAGNIDEVNTHLSDRKFDIIIDDGAHEWQSQIKLYHIWSKRVKSGGIYIIEDVQDVNGDLEKFHNAIPKMPTIVDRRWINGQPDDVILLYQF